MGRCYEHTNLKARLSEYDDRLRFFDEKLEPIAKRPNPTSEDLEEIMSRGPLDMAGIDRTEAENFVTAVIELYESTPDARQPIRDLFSRYSSANWALWPSQKPMSEDGFRKSLLRMSIDDREDPRDVMMRLGAICNAAENAGVKIQPILESVAAISSDGDWGSVRKLFLMAAVDYRRWLPRPPQPPRRRHKS